jgi:hypothetical protein
MAEISINVVRIKKILMYAAERKFAVPKLQREFVWDIKKACKLLDSIYSHIPIGTILVWDASRNNSNLLQHSHIALPSFDISNKRVWFILDGQQRLSVLYRIQQGEGIENSQGRFVDFDKVYFQVNNSRNLPFAKLNKANPKNHVRVSDILAPSWRRRLNRFKAQPRKYTKIAACREAILEYKMPLVFMYSKNIEEAREAFLRINALGTPLSTADRLFSKASSLDLRDLARSATLEWSDGFQHLPAIIILQTLCFALGRIEVGEEAINGVIERTSKRLNSGKLSREAFSKEWNKLKNSMGQAIDYVKKHFNVADFGFLPSTNMISTLTMFFLHHDNRQPSPAQQRELRKWFWATGVAQRYSGAGYRSNIIDDVNFFTKLAKRGKAKFIFRERVPKSKLLFEKYSAGSGLSKTFYCLLIGKKPRYLENNSEIPIDAVCSAYNQKQKHHVFPKALLTNRGFKEKEYNRICNICFIVAPENKSIGASKPRDYLREYLDGRSLPSFLRSHLLPINNKSALWKYDVKRNYKAFLRERMELISREFEKSARMRIFSEE